MVFLYRHNIERVTCFCVVPKRTEKLFNQHHPSHIYLAYLIRSKSGLVKRMYVMRVRCLPAALGGGGRGGVSAAAVTLSVAGSMRSCSPALCG